MTWDLLIGAAAAWVLIAAFYQIAAFTSLSLLMRRRIPPSRRPRPSCTFLRPLRGDDDSKEANLDDLCRFGIPIVAGVLSRNDPALALVRRVQARHPGVPLYLRAGEGPEGANRKVANLIQMLSLAEGEILIFTDADMRISHTALDPILAIFDDPRVGLVTCPYRSVAGRRAVERVDVIANNTNFLPSVALAERVEGVRFALGACIALRREVLDRIGGLHFLLDMLPDDYALAAAVQRAGYERSLAPVLLDHCVSPRSWLVMARRHIRWARTIHCVRPWAHAATALTHGLPPAIMMGAAALTHGFDHGGGAALAVLALWLAVRLGCIAAMRKTLGLSLLDIFLVPAVDLWSFVVLIAGILPIAVWWDDRRLAVGERGRILSVIEPPHAARALHGPLPPEAPAVRAGTQRKKSKSLSQPSEL